MDYDPDRVWSMRREKMAKEELDREYGIKNRFATGSFDFDSDDE